MAAVDRALPGRGDLMTAGEVAEVFGVDRATVVRWDVNGRLLARCRTPGGHRRWRRADVNAALQPKRVPDAK